jgi:ParB-like chromosome segregation protein Spo0J
MLSIEYKSTGELVPYVNNSRTHSEQQVQQVAASIKEFGFTNPILIDHDGGIIAGHGRLQAAQLLSLDEVPTITLEGLTEAQRKAYVIADNKLALNAGWNDELLKVEIEALTDLDFNLDILGWDVLPDFVDDIDYSILDDEDLEDELGEMTDDVKKAIQIEFESHDYEEAKEVIKFWRDKEAYVGGLILDYLRKEMNKL